MIVCAVDDYTVGIEIEQICQIDLSVAKRICTGGEKCYICSIMRLRYYTTDEEILTRFLKIWTPKKLFKAYWFKDSSSAKAVCLYSIVQKPLCIIIGKYTYEQIDKQNYSAPYEYMGQKADVQITESTVEVFFV